MKFIFIARSYPTSIEPVKHVFLQKLVWAISDLGHECTVIRPVNNFDKRFKGFPVKNFEYSRKGNKINLFFPRYNGYWFSKKFKYDFISSITLSNFTRSILDVINNEKLSPDILYGHFLSPAGLAVSKISNKLNVKGFAAFGESSLWSIKSKNNSKSLQLINSLTGVVSVSTENKKRLLDNGILSDDQIRVFPNGVDLTFFKQLNKTISRKKFNFNENDFIVAFVGSFSERKGVLRVAEALKDEKDLKLAFAGRGDLLPTNDNCIFAEAVLPENMPQFLSAADVFVLPTLNEGCCNAIIEAMACGLPIVSSNLPFNDDILNENNAIRIDPNNINEIRNAVLKIKNNNELRNEMSLSALEKAKELDINKRALNIVNWISSFKS